MTIRRLRAGCLQPWRLAAAALAVLSTTWGAPRPAPAQLNFRPLERGDVREVEQRLVVVRSGEGKEFALELGGQFALQMRDERAKNLDGLDSVTRFDQDFRLTFRTWFHQDVAMHLTLQTTPAGLDDANLRAARDEERGALADGKALTLAAREAYLLWNANPNSHLIFGKQEVSLGDRRGKVYEAIMPAAQFDCRVGTWCMPFGAIKIGQNSADWIYNWALAYRAWDEQRNTLRQRLEVEVFRIFYTEQNVPLGKNLGPGRFNKDCRDPVLDGNTCTVNASQVVDEDTTAHPIYYDANGWNYGGVRVDWLGDPLFWNLDYTSGQGHRLYHRFRDPEGGIVGVPIYGTGSGSARQRESVNGYTWESEFGYRWPQGRLGLRYMTATGDDVRGEANGGDYLRVLQGYHEITPGSYRGTRLYFNGGDSRVDLGGGLGHSVNNTTLLGLFLDLDYAEEKRLGYLAGVYHLRRNRVVRNVEGKLRSDIGVEWDNVLIWRVHKALQLQFEANLIKPGGAFALDDFTPPDAEQNLLIQGIARIVYTF
jgi:hypothetical protein